MFISYSQSIGFDLGKGSLKIAKLMKTRQGWDIPFLKEISHPDHVKLLYKHLKEGTSVSAVNTRDILLRPCDIQAKKSKDIFAALDFHVEPLLPYPMDRAIIQAQITETLDNTTFLHVAALRKDHLENHLRSLSPYTLDPEIVTSKMHALASLSSILPSTDSPILIVHEGGEEISLVLVEKGKVLTARSIDVKKEYGLEIQKALLSISAAYKSKNFETIYLFSKSIDLKNALAEATEKPILPPMSPSLSLTQDELIHYGLAIGCAISEGGINFRQKEFSYPYPFRKYKKPLTAFFTLSILLTFAICLFSELSLSHKKEALTNSYTTLLKESGYSIDAIPAKPDEFLSSLNNIEQDIRNTEVTFPLLPQIPKVKELLSWFSSLPEAKGVSIDSIHYQMVKRPDFTNRLNHYAVRVDLEASAKNPSSMKAFQEALKKVNPMINTNEEISWNPTKTGFRGSFYLKDKTKYE